MRSFVSLLWLIALAAPLAAAGRGPAPKVPADHWGANLVGNAGFETGRGGPEGWSLPAGQWACDAVEHKSGERSLRFTNRDPKVYRLVAAPVKLIPGVRYRFSVWVKGKEVRSAEPSDKGAGICIEWMKADGTWLGGSYGSCKAGTFDWSQVVHEGGPVPTAAGRAHVVLYMRRGTTGTAWFDDVRVEAIRGPLMAVRLLEPAYRACVETPTEGRTLTVQVRVNRHEHDVPAGTLAAKVLLRELSGPPLGRFPPQRVPEGREAAALSWKLPRLRPRSYLLSFALDDRTGKQLAMVKTTLRVAEAMRRKVTIDARRRLVVDGKPFFPLGLYLGPTEDEHLARIAKGGFNTVLCYGYGVGREPRAYLDRAHKHGLKVIYSVKDFYDGTRWFPKGPGKRGIDLVRDYVTRFREHPALLAWYTNDELGPQHLPALRKAYDLVCRLDPHHPAFQVLCRPSQNHLYYGVTDILGVDPYPIPRHPVTMVGDWMETAHEAMSRRKPAWCVPQIFQWGVYHHDPKQREPTFDEKRAMVYLALVHRAQGLICYSYYDLFKAVERGKKVPAEVFERRWREVSSIAKAVRQIIPFLLEGEEAGADLKAALRHRVLKHGAKACVIAVNTHSATPATTDVAIPGARATRLDTGRPAPVADGRLRAPLAPLGAGVFLIQGE